MTKQAVTTTGGTKPAVLGQNRPNHVTKRKQQKHAIGSQECFNFQYNAHSMMLRNIANIVSLL